MRGQPFWAYCVEGALSFSPHDTGENTRDIVTESWCDRLVGKHRRQRPSLELAPDAADEVDLAH